MGDFFGRFWEIVTTLIDPRNLSHPEEFQKALNQPGVFWAAFAAVCVIIFTETGLLIGFLLPGDSLLVVLGLVAKLANWNIVLLIFALSIAAVLGDTVGYGIGAKAGPALFKRPDSRFFKQEYLLLARSFFERHGGKSIIFARFVPIVRTFVPVVAGAAKMEYRRFLFFNIFGGIGWIVSMLLFGYFVIDIADPIFQRLLGRKDFTWAKNIDILAATVILVSILPIMWKAQKQWRKQRARKQQAVNAENKQPSVEPTSDEKKNDGGTVPAIGMNEQASLAKSPLDQVEVKKTQPEPTPDEHKKDAEAMPAISMNDYLREQLAELKTKGLYKAERRIESPQNATIEVAGKTVINFCANNYLGLANHPAIVEAARKGLDDWGYGLSSVRFICGTQDIHRQCEQQIARFFGKADSILYISCFDANGGLFEPLLGEQDAILSDELNHASIIDGVRLCKAKRLRYKHNDLADLKAKLEETKDCRFKMIFTDSVFSMDGDLAKLPEICELADQHNAIVGIDDCHGTGHLGANGRGAAEELGVLDRIDIITGTLGKTLGGASGGFTAASAEIVDWLKNRSRPYLFSNSVPPSLVAAGMKALELVETSQELREKSRANTKKMRAGLEGAGFTIKPGPTPILPVMLGDAAVASKMADELLKRGIYVIGFSFPVVPQGQARIRLQVSAAHSDEQIDQALAAFRELGLTLGVLKTG